MRVLVTGSAGFIGFHVVERLLAAGHEVAGIDGMTPYYDVRLKHRRNAILMENSAYRFHDLMIEDVDGFRAVWRAFRPEIVIHLAAQAGVRYSLENPKSFVGSNIVGSFNLLELAREHPPKHLLLASTSSVYGANAKTPFAETDCADHPMTLYAATKRASELMAHSYAHLFGVPTTAFRFFTVYGPWGRPDMAPIKFVSAIVEGRPIDIYNHGRMQRDFTYIDDLAEAIVRLIPVAPPLAPDRAGGDAVHTDSLSPIAPYRVVNIGNAEPVQLLDFVHAIEAAIGVPAVRNYLPMQPGDVPFTHADTRLLERLTGFRPSTPISVGVPRLVDWYRAYRAR